jgi:hypothetical protein
MAPQENLHMLNSIHNSVRFVLILVVLGLCASCMSPAAKAKRKAELEEEKKDAVEKVREIVNQEVPQVRRTEDMPVAIFRPGWFHKGADRPDYNHVDVRKTQQTSTYSKHEYVTSDLNDGIAFPGDEVEFNPATKYFYDDYSLPKKKLTDEEMEEINRLYRIIGHCEEELAKL